MIQPTNTSRRPGPLIVTAIVLVLLVLHQDNWFWTDGTLVFGFLPIGLFWHACISLAAAVTWYLATKIAWPLDEAAAADAQDEARAEGKN